MTHNLSQSSRYAIILILLGLIALIEARHPFPFFRLATFIFVFLVFAVLASLLRGKWRDGLIVLASLAFGLCVGEAVATILEIRGPPVPKNGLFVPQPVIGWGPQHPGRYHVEKTVPESGVLSYSADYTIDSNLVRETRSVEIGPTIVFFGDSMTFGEGVNDADTLPQVFSDLLGRKQRVLNLGFSAYGPQQFLVELQTGRFDGVIGAQPRLFIFMTAAWHAERVTCKARWMRHSPRYVLENGQVVFKGECDTGPRLPGPQWLEGMASYRLVIRHYFQKVTHETLELYIRILLAAVNLATEKYGVATLIPYITAPPGYLMGTGFSDDEIIQRLRDGGAIVVDVSLAKEEAAGAKLHIPGDGHPTPFANRLRASLIKDYIENRIPGIPIAGVP